MLSICNIHSPPPKKKPTRFDGRAVVCGGEVENGTVISDCFSAKLDGSGHANGDGNASEWRPMPSLVTGRSGEPYRRTHAHIFLFALHAENGSVIHARMHFLSLA